MTRRAVFAACGRSCAPFLPGVLANIDRWAKNYAETAFVFVENDSDDDTRAQLESWLAAKDAGHLITKDGLAAAFPVRSERIAAARNAYLEFIRTSEFRNYDELIILDLDDINAPPATSEALKVASDYLWAKADLVGVFANAVPFYYDVWALRHPEWSPDDCWERVRQEAPSIGVAKAEKRFVYSRQVSIRPGTPPILVESAFGGLGVYKMQAALNGAYKGRREDGVPVCEHVTFNADLRSRGGELVVHPDLVVPSPAPHIRGALRPAKRIQLTQAGRKAELITPLDHPLEQFRQAHPLFRRRLPDLAALLSRHAPESVVVDVGANVGDTVALCRLAGCQLAFIAIETSLTNCKFLWVNALSNPRLLEPVKLVWGFVGSDQERAEVTLSSGRPTQPTGVETKSVPTVGLAKLLRDRDVCLVKTDMDGHHQTVIRRELGFLRAAQPILWLVARSQTSHDESNWRELFDEVSSDWPLMVAFDNFGFAIYAGESRAASMWLTDLMAYSRRQRRLYGKGSGLPTIYHLEIALFPKRFYEHHRRFVANLKELSL